MAGLQKDCHRGTGGDKEGFISIGRFDSQTTSQHMGKGAKKDGKHMNFRNNRKVGRNLGKIYGK